MSLLDEAYEDFVLLNKVREKDGYGGYTTTWKDGPTISGAMVIDQSMQARTAEAQGVKSVYTFTSKKNIVLEFHDVLRRVRDSKIFRVTSDGDDKFTPNSASLNMRQVTAEEWVIPSEVTNG